MSKEQLSLVVSAVVLLASACGDDDGGTPDSGAADGGMDASTQDAARNDASTAEIDRGRYLVDHVSACNDCHTPRKEDGSLDMDKYLSGAECFVRIPGEDGGMQCLHTKNLTNHETGLRNRSNTEIKDMFLNGIRPNGGALNPAMPYWVFHNMTPSDANAIVAYLRTVPGINHMVPPSDPVFEVSQPATPLASEDIPTPASEFAEHDSAVRGRYLAAMAGLCVECHTEPTEGQAKPIDVTKIFAGGRAFSSMDLGISSPPFPATIYTTNLTPHASGIPGRTTAQIAAELKEGVDPAGNGICPPMPAGAMNAYGGLTDQDAADIANYIRSLPPLDNTIPSGCAIPPP